MKAKKKEIVCLAGAPLSEEEAAAWESLVEEGRKIREPILAKRQEIRQENIAKSIELRGSRYNPRWVESPRSKKNSMSEIPVAVKRWLVSRAAGFSFKKAGEASGANWLAISDAKCRNEDVRCAWAAQEERSRQLMKAKAQSVVEQSQDEDARVSMAQTQVSMKILSSLDRENFGDEIRVSEDPESAVRGVGGGFVINLVQDAARIAEAAPEVKPKKALVYTDV